MDDNLKNIFIIILFLNLPFTSSISFSTSSADQKFLDDYVFFGYNTTRREALARFIAAHQVEGGGFVLSLIDDEPLIIGTYYAVKALKILGMLNYIDVEGVINFIMSLYNGETFPIAPLHPKSFMMSFVWYYVETLYELNSLHLIDREKLVNWILSMQDPETGLFYDDYYEGERSNLLLASTFAAVYSLYRLNALDRVNGTKIILSVYKYFYDNESGLFRDLFWSFFENMYGVLLVKVLGGLDRWTAYRNALKLTSEFDAVTGLLRTVELTGVAIYTIYELGHMYLIGYLVNRTIESILEHQDSKWGGFINYFDVEIDDSLRDDLRVTYFGILALHLLNATDRLDEPFYVEEEPKYMGKWPNVDISNELISSGGGIKSLFLFVLASVTLFISVISIVVYVTKFIDEKLSKFPT